MIYIKKEIRLSALLALSVILSILESLIPILNGVIPGFKIGLANIVVVYVLYKYTFKDAILLSILRVILVGFVRTGIFNSIFIFSMCGALFSILFMYIFKRFTKLSPVGISIIGSTFHLLAQLLCASIFISNFNIIYYIPFILIISILSGTITGILSNILIKNS